MLTDYHKNEKSTISDAPIAGKYRLIRKIARGGTADVYLAEETGLGQKLAVKIISTKEPEVLRKSAEEGLFLAGLNHPAIPRVWDVVSHAGNLCIVMDYVEGTTLSAVMKKGTYSAEDVMNWAHQICSVMMYLHGRNPPVIYGDLKPSNLILDENGFIRLIDFGVACREGERALLGTPRYAAPELHKGYSSVQSDIYAFGKVLEELLKAKGRSTGTIRRIIRKCTAPGSSARYASFQKVLKDIEAEERKQARTVSKKQLIARLAFMAMVPVILAAGVFARNMCVRKEKEKKYEQLLEAASYGTDAQRIDACIAAIELLSDEPEAYLKLLDTYEEIGRFGPDESDVFLALYGRAGGFSGRDDEVLEKLNYKAGVMYMNFYDDEKSEGMAEKVTKAAPFFKRNHEIYEERTQTETDDEASVADYSELYFAITEFYKLYVLPKAERNSVETEEMEVLLDKICDVIDRPAEKEDKKVLLAVTVGNLRNLWWTMMDFGLPAKRIISFFRKIYKVAEKLSVGSADPALWNIREQCASCIEAVYVREKQL